jgi:hypothetical protein
VFNSAHLVEIEVEPIGNWTCSNFVIPESAAESVSVLPKVGLSDLPCFGSPILQHPTELWTMVTIDLDSLDVLHYLVIHMGLHIVI